ncbi:hypothetical protein Gotur_006959 [Gossypium turneri]
MVCFCFLVDQTKKVSKSKPAAGFCSRCGGGASVADMKTCTRFCYVPFYWKSWKAIICTFCGAILRSYHRCGPCTYDMDCCGQVLSLNLYDYVLAFVHRKIFGYKQIGNTTS